MQNNEVTTREFMALAGLNERNFFRVRQQYGEAFPQPVCRTKDGYNYRKADALDFITRTITERKADLLATVTALDERANEIAAQRLALVDGE